MAAQRLAWVTLIGAFVAFIGLCGGFAALAQYVLFDWTIDLKMDMVVSRGTAGVLRANDVGERNVRDTYRLESGDRVSVAELAQNSIVLRDPFETDTVVATLILRGGSQVKVATATRPRFLGEDAYRVELDELIGSLEVVIAPDLDREVYAEIRGNNGRVQIEEPGSYIISSFESMLRVSTEHGQALLVSAEREGQYINAGQVGELMNGSMSVLPNVAVALVNNSDLVPPPGTNDVLPQSWGCTREPSPDNTEVTPLGNFSAKHFEGRDTIYIQRTAEVQLLPASTRCVQRLGSGDSGMDVSELESLRIRVRMYLVAHSVPGCGQAGTECVLMVHLQYRNQREPEILRDWHQGFYVVSSEGLNWPQKCDTCPNDHVHVNDGVWFTFESEDLVQDLTDIQRDLRPVILESIEFYASGHAYEVYVDEINVIGQDFDQVVDGEVLSVLDRF